jgi:uncharacterized protein YecE (DUF72 family)
MAARIYVGTSGYSFKDWIGTVYPMGMNSRDFLSRYAKMFDTVEINSTYYRVPAPSMFSNMLKKVPEDFTFVVKLPKEMTHQREKWNTVVRPFLEGVAPLIEARQLGGFLAQFPYSFKSNSQTLDYLKHVADVLVQYDVPINIEFRHNSWYDKRIFGALKDAGLGFVNVDLPSLSALPEASNIITSDVAYYRLHGRNAKMWWDHPTPSHRYDYLYSDKQLEEWAERNGPQMLHLQQQLPSGAKCGECALSTSTLQSPKTNPSTRLCPRDVRTLDRRTHHSDQARN